MKVFNPDAISYLENLQLDILSQPDYQKGRIVFRAESGDFILYFTWSIIGLENLTYGLGVGCDEREHHAKDCQIVAAFEKGDGIKTFTMGLAALKVIPPKNWDMFD